MNQGTVNPYAAPAADLDVGVAADTQTLAARPTRFWANLVDNLVTFGIPFGVGVAAGIGHGEEESLLPVILAGIVFLGVAAYQAWMLATKGQTLGKKWLGVKIVKTDGVPVSFLSTVILRTVVPALLGIVPGFSIVNILFIFRDDRRCIHDLIAGTKVVEA